MKTNKLMVFPNKIPLIPINGAEIRVTVRFMEPSAHAAHTSA